MPCATLVRGHQSGYRIHGGQRGCNRLMFERVVRVIKDSARSIQNNDEGFRISCVRLNYGSSICQYRIQVQLAQQGKGCIVVAEYGNAAQDARSDRSICYGHGIKNCGRTLTPHFFVRLRHVWHKETNCRRLILFDSSRLDNKERLFIAIEKDDSLVMSWLVQEKSET